MVNQQIQRDLPVSMEIMDLEEAKNSGATALFGTACGPQIAGGMDIVETEVQLGGAAQTAETEAVEETEAEE
jgi:alanyl-tRNA synthetase